MSSDLTRTAAERQVRKIREYWAAQGMYPTLEIEAHTAKNQKTFYCVRSDMVDGMPLPIKKVYD